MDKMTVYYDNISGKRLPKWFVIRLGDHFNWNNTYHFISLNETIENREMHDFEDGFLSITVLLDDLILNSNKPGCFGVHLPTLKKRIETQYPIGIEEIQQFIIQVADIEMLLEIG